MVLALAGLDAPELGVGAVGGHEGVVGALLQHAPLAKDDDSVRVANRRQAVRDNKRGAVLHKEKYRVMGGGGDVN